MKNLLKIIPVRRLKLTLLPALLLFLIGGCTTTAPVAVNSDFARNANFQQYRTYNWYFETGSAESASNTNREMPAGYDNFLDQRIKNAINNNMATKGFQRTTTNPDIRIAYDVKVVNRTDVDRAYATVPGYGFGYGYHMGYRYNYGYNRFGPNYATVREYNEGTIIIDFIDPKDNQLVWRGWGEAVVNPDGSISEETVNRIVTEIMKRYPPQP